MADAKLVKRASSAFTGGGVVKRASSAFAEGGETRKMRVLPEGDVRGGMVKRASSAFAGGGEETRKMRVLPEGGETRKMRVLPEGDVRGGMVKRASSAFAGGGEETRKMRVLPEGGETRKMRVLPEGGETRKMRVLPDANIRAVVFPDAARDRERHFFSPDAQTSIHKRNLPHWAQDGKLIFVTFRLADSIPQTVLREWESQKEEWLSSHPEPWDDSVRIEYAKSFPEKMQDYLDSGYGACVLADSECRDAVESALEYFNGSRYVLHAYVVMANHVHVLMEIAAMDDYVSVLHSWKSYTANIINRLCGTSGPVWRKESYDRIIRNARHYDRVVEYIVKKNAKGRMETRKMRVLPEGDVRGGMVKRASSAFTGVGEETRKMRVLPEGDVRGGVVKRASSAFTGVGEETRKMRVLPGDGETRKMRVLPECDVRGGVVKRASSAFTGGGEETRKMRVLPGVGETRKMRVLPEGGETRKMRVLPEGVLGGAL